MPGVGGGGGGGDYQNFSNGQIAKFYGIRSRAKMLNALRFKKIRNRNDLVLQIMIVMKMSTIMFDVSKMS